MLSILCSTLWGQAGGFSVGVFVGGMMMSGKHKYKREDVKPDKLKAWYLSYLKNKKYPLIEDAARDARKVLDSIDSKLSTAKTIDDIKGVADFLKDDLANMVITEAGLRYFKDDRFKIPRIPVSSSDDLATTRVKYDKVYDLAIGALGPQDSTTLIYGTSSTTTGVFAQAQNAIATTRTDNLNDINDNAKRGAADFLQAVKDGSVDAALIRTFEVAATDYRTALAGGGVAQNDPRIQALTGAGLALVKAWVNGKIKDNFIRLINQKIAVVSEELDDPLQNALKAYQADKEVEPTADEYDPDDTGKALTSPELGKEAGEQGKWDTLEGEAKTKRIGLTYGFSVGYEKEMNKNHAFVGGNAFAKKDSLTIKYNLQVEKGNSAGFTLGELDAKPGYTFGVTVVAGKHLNPVFSVFGRGTFEFTKWGFTYDMKNDSPKMENDRVATQKLGNWVKQAAVGVGARYNFAPLWSAEVCYDFIPATKTTVRDFNKLGDDGRRRGYIYTSSQHRAFLKVVRFFNM